MALALRAAPKSLTPRYWVHCPSALITGLWISTAATLHDRTQPSIAERVLSVFEYVAKEQEDLP